MSNVNDFVKNDVRSASTDIINNLKISSIITDIEKEREIDCNFMNFSQFSDSFNTGNCLFILHELYIKLLSFVFAITFL